MEKYPQISKLKHIAIIMDGNGRWAKKRQHSRSWGHVRGCKTITNIIQAASDVNINALTLYSFSTENWSRPLIEIQTLFSLLKKFLKKEKKRIIKNNICFKIIGDISKLPQTTIELISSLQMETESNKGLQLTFAFGYGGRLEIINAVKSLLKQNLELNEDTLSKNLENPQSGEVDLLIRTGGDQRISNFLLWQSAYAELFFTKSEWPQFTKKEFYEIIQEVEQRERRFGNIVKTKSLKSSQKIAQGNHHAF